MVKNYRSIQSAYRDGYRITNIKDYGRYSVFTATKPIDENRSDNMIMQETNAKLKKFFGEAKLQAIRTEFGH